MMVILKINDISKNDGIHIQLNFLYMNKLKFNIFLW